MSICNIEPNRRSRRDFVMNGRSYPGGMLGGIVYEEVMDSDIFASLIDYAGFEG
jgi:hypothetical protein